MKPTFIYLGLVFGGVSQEHEVSIKSAITVFNELQKGENKNKYRIIPIYIDKNGFWHSKDFSERVLQNSFDLNKELVTNNIEKNFKGIPEETNKVQIWFPVLHGPNGEDGAIQGLFKLTGKPFVGAGVLGSALAMDKVAMKSAFKAAGLSQLPYIALDSSYIINQVKLNKIIDEIELKINYPCFIKPANLGSSIGITKAINREQLIIGMRKASSLDYRLVIEKGIKARELECGAIGKIEMKASQVGEVTFNSDWYDYETKYSSNNNQLLIPAPIPSDINSLIKNLTIKACKALAIKGMARVDFFYEEVDNKIWINEVNTLPGFTSQSMFPLLWEASGIKLERLVSKLVEFASE